MTCQTVQRKQFLPDSGLSGLHRPHRSSRLHESGIKEGGDEDRNDKLDRSSGMRVSRPAPQTGVAVDNGQFHVIRLDRKASPGES